MKVSVESICQVLEQSGLLPAEVVQALRQQWQREAAEAVGDVERFSRWLVVQGHVTEYQAGQLRRGQSNHFFLNQYKLVDRLSQGRLAGVYRAVHPLGAVVAIKVLPAGKVRNLWLFNRFQREARLALRLQHPNVVRTFQRGEANGIHYLVMEYLEGEPLKEVLQRRGKLPPAEAVGVLYQAFLGLQYLHEQRVVHRDLKPANLMIVPRPASDQPDTTAGATVKIVDVGFARSLADEEQTEQPEEAVELTGEDTLLGTPDYLAPEQAGDAHAADIRADIYSLGCVLFEAICGQPPFPDTNLNRQMLRHATEPPRPLREFTPDVPEGIERAVAVMLAKDPAQRFQTPREAAAALRPFLASEPPQQAPESDPSMRAYLAWLQTADQPRSGPPPSPSAVPTEPPASPSLLRRLFQALKGGGKSVLILFLALSVCDNRCRDPGELRVGGPGVPRLACLVCAEAGTTVQRLGLESLAVLPGFAWVRGLR
jgi:serine/threonine protein kinase